jgi:hypothetical protein
MGSLAALIVVVVFVAERRLFHFHRTSPCALRPGFTHAKINSEQKQFSSFSGIFFLCHVGDSWHHQRVVCEVAEKKRNSKGFT